MTRLNLVEACLLEVSGELGPKARGELLAHLEKNPAARAKFEGIAADYGMLGGLPGVRMSEEDRGRIKARVKRALRGRVEERQREIAAVRRQKLIHYALAGLSAAAAAVVIAAGLGIMYSSGAQKARTDQVASLNRTIERMATTDDRQTAYDQALADVDSSIEQLQSEGSSMAGVQTNEMTPLLDALASIPATSSPSDVMFDVPVGGM